MAQVVTTSLFAQVIEQKLSWFRLTREGIFTRKAFVTLGEIPSVTVPKSQEVDLKGHSDLGVKVKQGAS